LIASSVELIASSVELIASLVELIASSVELIASSVELIASSVSSFEASHQLLTPRCVVQVDALRDKIRPYLLRRQKADVEKSLKPLEETIIWVEMTLAQKKIYRALLESKREVLVAGLADAPLPSLLNMQIELRKCCNHAFLIKGVEASMTQGMK
jgi:SNF2 family DNA or RNA helicase